MTKATNNKAYQTRPKKKAYRHTFPITWLTKDKIIGKCSLYLPLLYAFLSYCILSGG